jgi:hypothetical protein
MEQAIDERYADVLNGIDVGSYPYRVRIFDKIMVSAVVLIGFILDESAQLGVRWRWLPVIATVIVGVSLGLPLFLGLRESALHHRGARTQTVSP